MVVVPLLWLRQQLGIRCRMNCETRISTVPPSTKLFSVGLKKTKTYVF